MTDWRALWNAGVLLWREQKKETHRLKWVKTVRKHVKQEVACNQVVQAAVSGWDDWGGSLCEWKSELMMM